MSPDDVPSWLRQLVDAAPSFDVRALNRVEPPATGGKASAVLVLFGEGPQGPDVLLIERSHDVRDHHAGQIAFPGGAVEPDDETPIATAIREATEETGLEPSGVDVLASLPTLWLAFSGFLVVPVLGWWREPCAVGVVDPREVAAVARVPIAKLADPANRFTLRHRGGRTGPAFDVDGMLVWGFTGGLLDRLLDVAGWARPWRRDDVRDHPPGRS